MENNKWRKLLTKRNIIIAFFAVLIIIFFYSFFLKPKGSSFTVEKAVLGAVIREVSETGTVKAQNDIGLSFKNSGRIQKIYVKAGDEVVAGQKLAELDTSDLRFQLSSAMAGLDVNKARQRDAEVSLENARQNFEDVKTKANSDMDSAYSAALSGLMDSYAKISSAHSVAYEVQQSYFVDYQGDAGRVIDSVGTIKTSRDSIRQYIDAINNDIKQQAKIDIAVSKMKISLSNTRDALDVIRQVVSSAGYRSFISSTDKANLDSQKASIVTVYNTLANYEQGVATTRAANEKNINAAKSQITSLENQLKSGNAGLYPSQVGEAETKIFLLNNQINDSAIKSPVSGKVTKVAKKEGEIENPSELVISMLSFGPFEIKVDIYEEDIVGVEIGNPVKIDLVAFPDQTMSGKVVAIDPAEKVVDGVVYYETTIAFDEIKKGTRSGMTADIAIETARKENTLIIPKRAVEKNNGEKSVRVLVKNKPEKRTITTGLEGNDYVEIISGVNVGEEIIIGEKI